VSVKNLLQSETNLLSLLAIGMWEQCIVEDYKTI